jgi:hypothetical protein
VEVGLMDRRGFLGLLSAAVARKAWAQTGAPAKRGEAARVSPAAVSYVEVSREAGLDFQNVFGAQERKRYLLETTGCGVAWIDYDGDGFPDLFLVNGTTLEGFPSGQAPTNRLYHNNGNGTFTDVTAKAGLLHSGWGQGVCAGDYDNDGRDDFFVTCYGKNLLYHNNGDGTFTESAERAGVAGDAWRWNTGCAFFDYDRDGLLDLFVANYVDQGKDFHLLPQPGSGQFCQYKGIPMACGPRGLPTGRNYLYHNNGDGTFTDVSEKSGIVLLPEKHYALGVISVDYDNDGWPDLYVACDSTASILYHNNHDGTFTDQAFVAGVAYSGDGESQAGMGVTAGDYSQDGYLDLAKTNFSDDTPDLYHNNGDGTFRDATFTAGLGNHPNYLGWGIGFVDFDNDGWLDLFMANGHLDRIIDQYHIDSTYAEPKLLYHNQPGPAGQRRFVDVSQSSGPGVQLLSSSRGVAFADYDNDGDVDIAINNMNGPAYLLRNEGGNRHHWIKIKTVGVKSNRDGIGARVEVRAGPLRQIDEVRSGGSYISQNDLRLHFGLGEHRQADEIILRWPSGQVDRLLHVPAGRTIVVQEGKGIVNG